MQYLSIKNILIVYHLHYTSLAILNQKTSHQQYVFEMWIACSSWYHLVLIMESSSCFQIKCNLMAHWKRMLLPRKHQCPTNRKGISNNFVEGVGLSFNSILYLIQKCYWGYKYEIFYYVFFRFNKHWFPLFTLYFVHNRNKLKSETRYYHLTLSKKNVVNYITFEYKK